MIHPEVGRVDEGPRDPKTALVIFNRDRQMSTVLAKIPTTVREHANFKKRSGEHTEARFSFALGHNDDPDRELALTVLVFDLPRARRSK